MQQSKFLSFLASVIAMLAIIGAFNLRLAAQGGEKKPADEADKKAVDEATRAAIDADLEDLEKSLAEKVTKPEEIEARRLLHSRLLEALVRRWSDFDEKQRPRFRTDIDKVYEDKNDTIRRKVFETLGKMKGGEKAKEAQLSTKSLLRYYGLPEQEAKPELKLEILKQIGLLAHPSGAPLLTDLLKDKETKFVVAAIDAMAGYADAETPLKKDLFENVLRSIPSERGSGGSAGGGARGGRQRPNSDRTFDDARRKEIIAAADKTFAKLTKVTHAGPEEWTRWWNKDGKRATKW